MTPQSLGCGLPPLALSPAQSEYLSSKKITKYLESRLYEDMHREANLPVLAMFVVFTRYMIETDPFILWTLSRLGSVSKKFYETFSEPNRSIWTIMTRLLFPGNLPDNYQPHMNESLLVSQLGIDPKTFSARSEDRALASIRGEIAEDMGLCIDPTAKPISGSRKWHFSPRQLFISRIMLYYQLPRDRIFCMYRTLNAGIPLENFLQFMPFILENSIPAVMPPVNHCGSFGDYIEVLRSPKLRAIEMLKLKCQYSMNQSLSDFLRQIWG
jgi:hypothetical protein